MAWQAMEQEQQTGQLGQMEQEEQNQDELELNHYRQLFQQLVEEEERLHADNQKRIKAGIHCLIWIPMIFMVLLFLTESEKVIFLILWIASLFLIAAYLIYVEYLDFKAQERLCGYRENEGAGLNSNLIGSDMEAFEETVVQLLHQIDEKKAANREKMLLMLGQSYERLSGNERKGAHHD